MNAINLEPFIPHTAEPDASTPEPLLNIRQAAKAIGVKYWLLLHAVNRGDVPTYTLGNTRRRVRLSDIEAMIQASRSQ